MHRSPTRVTVFYDFISPYSYLAFTQLEALAHRSRVRLVPRPVLFAGLLAHHGQLGPAEIPAKRAWVGRDILRKAADLGVALRPLAHHPFNPLGALRAVSAIDDDSLRFRLSLALFRAVWADGKHVADPAVLAAVLQAADADAVALVAAASDPAIKQRLRDQTEDAVARGVFGVPSFLADGVSGVFWGLDDLVHLERALRGDDPVDADLFAAWEKTVPSASRRRPR